MGIAPTGKRVGIRYMDFWKVVDGKIVDNWVTVSRTSCASSASIPSTVMAGKNLTPVVKCRRLRWLVDV